MKLAKKPAQDHRQVKDINSLSSFRDKSFDTYNLLFVRVKIRATVLLFEFRAEAVNQTYFCMTHWQF